MDLQGVNASAELLTETTELTLWQKLMRYELTPEAQRDWLLLILLLILLCAISKVIYDLKENRRLKKVWEAYVQRRNDDER